MLYNIENEILLWTFVGANGTGNEKMLAVCW
jgi:hypothetical protein